jgi:hypothetical protein
LNLSIAFMAALAVFSTALAHADSRADASAANPAQADTPVPKLQYRSVFRDTPTGVEEQNTDWKKANAQAGEFPRGHADLLKWEALHAPPASAPASAAKH